MSHPIPTTQSPAKITVRVKRNSHGYLEVKSNHNLPLLSRVLPFLTPTEREVIVNQVGRNSSVNHAISANSIGIAASKWSKAIARAIADTKNDMDSCTSEILAVKGPAYLAIGSAVFRLDPTSFITSGEKALPALRAKIKETANLEAERIKEVAREQAREITSTANTTAHCINGSIQTAREELERLREATQNSWTPPDWIKERELCLRWRRNDGLYNPWLSFSTNILIKRFCVQKINDDGHNVTYTWKARPVKALQVPLMVMLKVPDMTINVTLISIDSTQMTKQLPHISTDRACMKAGDAPARLTSFNDLSRLGQSVERTMQEVNLNSLLMPYLIWHPNIRRSVPTVLRPYIEAFPNYPAELLATADTISSDQPPATFHLDPTQSPTPATPEITNDDDL